MRMYSLLENRQILQVWNRSFTARGNLDCKVDHRSAASIDSKVKSLRKIVPFKQISTLSKEDWGTTLSWKRVGFLLMISCLCREGLIVLQVCSTFVPLPGQATFSSLQFTYSNIIPSCEYRWTPLSLATIPCPPPPSSPCSPPPPPQWQNSTCAVKCTNPNKGRTTTTIEYNAIYIFISISSTDNVFQKKKKFKKASSL